MASTSRHSDRRVATRFILLTVGWLGCAFAWASVCSFNIADPPSTSVWPNNSPPENLCGTIGALVAHTAFLYFGWGVFPMLGMLTVGLAALSKGAPASDMWLRLIGLLMIGSSSAAAATMLLTPSDADTIHGPGGIVGLAVAPLLLQYLQALGTWMALSLVLVVGCVLTADNFFAAFFRHTVWAAQHTAPVIVRGSTAVASAGAAMANGIGGSLARGGRARPADDINEKPASRTASPAPTRPAARPATPAPAPASARPATPAEREPTRKSAKPPPPPIEDDEDEVDADEPEARAPRGTAPAPPEVESDDEDDLADEPAAEIEELPPPPPPKPAPLAVRSIVPPTPKKPPAPTSPPPRRQTDDNYTLPALTLLEPAVAIDRAAIENTCREKAYILEQTLNEFRLEVQVVAIETGPVITVFELKLAPGIKVSQIASLSNDMARALKAPAVRVVAPLPGKSTIGIEVPNVDKEKVRLRDIIETYGQRADQHAIPLYLGKDASGAPLVSDLTRMPHLLIAGTTGSGKSVCVGSIIMSVLMLRSPSEVHMIMVDPKVVELSMYKDVPHLICPIVTEMQKAGAILEWASTKMDERYAMLAEVGVKDIRSYNRLGAAGLRERLHIENDEEFSKIPVKLPYIIIIIDELADLMMMSPKETEFHLCRIAQKSRAVGIHLIVATQRPQANVVTGLIKSNLPSRISFRVSSRLDSRIVLDQNGGEVLMGQGDMLFLPPGSSKLVRAQGTFVDDDELRAVVKYCRSQREPDFHPELIREPGAGGDGAEERDELFDDAVETIVASGRGSVSLLQRRFNIGYSRASRLVDQMYAAGIVGEYKGSQAREVLLTKEEWQALRAQRDREEAEEG